jgi:trigger factor
MPKVVREDIDTLNATLTVTIEKSDYEPKLKSELHKYQKEAHMKGFRKGKVPASIVLKMYGKPLMAEIISNLLQEEVTKYLGTAENLDFLIGQPLPVEDQPPLDFDVNQLGDYTFKFDIGQAEPFELQGVGPDTVITHHRLEVTDEMIDGAIEKALEDFKDLDSVEDTLQDGDYLTLHIRELEQGQPKEDGVDHEFDLSFDQLASDALKDTFRALKKGDTLKVNPFELEAELEGTMVRKYLLGLEDDDEREVGTEFDAEITDVRREIPSEMGPKFYKFLLGEDAPTTEEEVREAIKESIMKGQDRNVRPLLHNDIREKLLELNPVKLPEAFIKRTVKAQNEEMTAEELESELPQILESIRWDLLRSQIAKKFDLKVEEEELLQFSLNSIMSNLGGSIPPGMEDFLKQTAARMLYEDEERYRNIYNSVRSEKIMEAVAGAVTLESVFLSPEGFNELLASRGYTPDADEEE